MKVSSQSRRPLASNSARNARQSRSHTSCSSQTLSLRQQVEALGYPSGRSRHRAPVFKTHRIPSSTKRLSVQGRPPRGWRGGAGSRGSIFAHCLSVRRTLRRATKKTPKATTAWSLHRFHTTIAPQGVMKPLLEKPRSPCCFVLSTVSSASQRICPSACRFARACSLMQWFGKPAGRRS